MSWENYRIALIAWTFVGALTFLYLIRRTAPFGRHNRQGWGPTLPNALGWAIMEFALIPFLLLPVWASGRMPGLPAQLMMALLILHYLHRGLIFPFLLKTRGKRMPLVIALSAIGFNFVNGWSFGTWFGRFADYPQDWFTDLRFLGGAALFVAGAALNLRHDYALIRLRKKGDAGYRIPQGGLFEKVSCPNHFGEMLEWTGFAILTWSLPGLVFAFWTVANVLPRSLAHHRWYRDNFPDYPSERRAVFPGLL
jgi:3-oxo-5-alpha-steroid 4-dehydrogenase 1